MVLSYNYFKKTFDKQTRFLYNYIMNSTGDKMKLITNLKFIGNSKVGNLPKFSCATLVVAFFKMHRR